MSVLDIISYGGERELWAILTLRRIAIFIRDRTGASVRTAQTVQTDHEEPCHVKGLTWTAHKRTPPVSHVCAATQCMAYDKRIVSAW